jgi:hypothetical protein
MCSNGLGAHQLTSADQHHHDNHTPNPDPDRRSANGGTRYGAA